MNEKCAAIVARADARLNRASIAVGEYLREMPVKLIKLACSNGYDNLSDFDPHMIAFGMRHGCGGRVSWLINERDHGRKLTQKVASGDDKAFFDVLKRGYALGKACNLYKSSIKQAMCGSLNGRTIHEFLADTASDIIGTGDAGTPGFRRLIGLPKESHGYGNISKTAAVKVASAHGSGSGSMLRGLWWAYPSLRKAAQAVAIAQYERVRNSGVKSASAKDIDSALFDMALSSHDDGLEDISNAILANDEIRRRKQREVFEKAGAAALVHHDPHSLALCVHGLAVDGAFGLPAQLRAMNKLAAEVDLGGKDDVKKTPVMAHGRASSAISLNQLRNRLADTLRSIWGARSMRQVKTKG